MTSADYAIVAVYLLVVVWMGGRFSSGQKSLKEFFLGSRNIPGGPRLARGSPRW